MRIPLALALIALPLAAHAAAPPASARCIDSSRVSGREPEGDRAIIFTLSNGQRWRSELGTSCPGLAHVGRFRTLVTHQWSSQLCRGDQVSAVDQLDLEQGRIETAPRCPLGDFTPLPPLPRR